METKGAEKSWRPLGGTYDALQAVLHDADELLVGLDAQGAEDPQHVAGVGVQGDDLIGVQGLRGAQGGPQVSSAQTGTACVSAGGRVGAAWLYLLRVLGQQVVQQAGVLQPQRRHLHVVGVLLQAEAPVSRRAKGCTARIFAKQREAKSRSPVGSHVLLVMSWMIATLLPWINN